MSVARDTLVTMVPFPCRQLQEMEIECNKLREDLTSMRKAVADSTSFESSDTKGGPAAKELMGQWWGGVCVGDVLSIISNVC